MTPATHLSHARLVLAQLLAAAGTDASEVFRTIGHTPNAQRILAQFAIAPSHQLVPAERAHQRAGLEPTWSSTALAVMAQLRSGEGRSTLGRVLPQLAKNVLSALFHDLTEGRPDCRRLVPAVWRLSQRSLHEVLVRDGAVPGAPRSEPTSMPRALQRELTHFARNL